MPSDWQTAALSELTEADTPITYGVVKPGPEDADGVPFIRGGDIANGRVLTGQLRTISSEVSQQYRRTQLRGGEIVVSLVGNPGQVAIVPDSLSGANIARQAGLVRLRADVETRFVKYFLSSRLGQEALGAQALGSVQQVINLRDLKTVRVPVPPLPEQRAIAHILGTLDDKIELNRRMSEALEAMARALFKSWFVDFDPVRAKADGRDTGLPSEIADLFPDRFVDSELGEIPEGWEVKPLDEIAHFQNGLALQKYRPKDDWNRIPVVKIAQLRSGKADSGEWATSALKPECIIDDGDVVFSWSGSLLVRVWGGGRAALNQHLFKVTSKDCPRWFYFDALLYHLPEFRRIAASKATTMGHIQRHHLSNALFVVPPKITLDTIGRIFSPLVERSVALELNSRELAVARDTLLPKLISGEMRVNDVESFADEIVS